MSYGIDTTFCPDMGACEAIVMGVAEVAGRNNQTFRSTPVGTIQALRDELNLVDASYDINDNGSVRAIRIHRIQRGTEDEVSSELTCNAGPETPIVEQHINPADFFKAEVGLSATIAELQSYCNTASQIRSFTNGTGNGPSGSGLRLYNEFITKIMTKMNALRRYINQTAITKIMMHSGLNVNYNSTAPQNVPLINAIDGSKIEAGLQTIIHDMVANEAMGPFYIVGFGNFDRFNTSFKYGCCNYGGLNWDGMSADAPYRYYVDHQIPSLSGDANRFFILAPGETQFVFYNDTVLGALSMDSRHGDTIYGTLPDPLLPGVSYDVAIQEVNCDGVGNRTPRWEIKLYLHYDIAITPPEAYQMGDRLHTVAGAVNGIVQYTGLAV